MKGTKASESTHHFLNDHRACAHRDRGHGIRDHGVGVGDGDELSLRQQPALVGSQHARASRDGNAGDYGKQIPLPVEVRCYDSGVDFDNAYYNRTGRSTRLTAEITTMAYYAGGNTIHMRTLTCSQAERFARGIITPLTVNAFSTLLHEAIHRQGDRNEHTTEQYAIGAMYAAGELARYNSLRAKGYASPSAAVTSEAGWEAFNLAVAVNHIVSPGAYRISRPEALAAKRNTWTLVA
jgi:hypothetical protein